MKKLTDQLSELRTNDPDVAVMLDTFDHIDHVYGEALKAMGVGSTTQLDEPVNSAEIKVSFQSTQDHHW